MGVVNRHDADHIQAVASVHAADEKDADGLITLSRRLKTPVVWDEEVVARQRTFIQNGLVNGCFAGPSRATEPTARHLSYSSVSSEAGESTEPEDCIAAAACHLSHSSVSDESAELEGRHVAGADPVYRVDHRGDSASAHSTGFSTPADLTVRNDSPESSHELASTEDSDTAT
jgi:hypothetical protein